MVRRRIDVAGVVLLMVGLQWPLASAATAGGDPAPVIALTAALGVTVVAASVATRRLLIAVPATIVAIGVLVSLGNLDEVFSSAPMSDPFGYANAKAAFYVSCTVAAAMLALLAEEYSVRVAGAVCGGLFVFITFASGSLAAVLLLLVPIACALLALFRRPKVAVALCAALVALAALTGIVLGTVRSNGRMSEVRDSAAVALSTRRLDLWRDAVVLIRTNPAWGVGPGRFDEASFVAAADPDARWAHNGYLQGGAELGIVGLLLLMGAWAWGFVRLASSPDPGIATALSASALAVLGVHASVDYVLNFAALPLVTAALAAVGMAYSQRRSSTVSTRRWS